MRVRERLVLLRHPLGLHLEQLASAVRRGGADRDLFPFVQLEDVARLRHAANLPELSSPLPRDQRRPPIMSTIASEALSDAARKFVESGPHKLLICADWVEAADGRTFETIDPSTGETICEVAQAGAEDVERAAQAARGALEGKWGKMPAAQRSVLINRLADLIEQNSEELAQLESLDNGKPVTIAGMVDIPQAVAHLRYYAGWPTKIEGETIPVSWPNMFVYTLKEPVGVCGQITPCAFALPMASWKISPALAAGCTVILKPAEQTPLSAIRLGQLVPEAGFPEGVVNVLTGDGSTGAALVDS